MSHLEAEWMRYWLDVYEGKYGRRLAPPTTTETLRSTARRSYYAWTRKERRATEWATSYATKR